MIWKHKELMIQMIKRDVIGRYKGSLFGILWSFFNPLLMLSVYTIVFGFIFKSHWTEGTKQISNTGDFALLIFMGIIIHSLLAECMNRAPSLIISNVNYVKKVVFPLEILPCINLGSALFHTLVSLLVWLVFHIILTGTLHWTSIFIPLYIVPLVLMSLGISWFLSAMGVYFRDIQQAMGVVTTILFFLAPVFYPLDVVPETLRPLLYLNPLTFFIEGMRDITYWGKYPNWLALIGLYILSISLASAGYYWFQHLRKGFADVV